MNMLSGTLVAAIQRRINKWRLRSELSRTSAADILGFISLHHLFWGTGALVVEGQPKGRSRATATKKTLQGNSRKGHSGRISAQIHLLQQ